jgi:hypothetical protein
MPYRNTKKYLTTTFYKNKNTQTNIYKLFFNVNMTNTTSHKPNKLTKHFNKFYTTTYSLLLTPPLLKLKYIQLKYYYSFLKNYNNSYTLLFVQNNFSIINKTRPTKILLLSFKRNMFFPTLLNSLGHTYTTLSLGTFLSFFLKPRSFKKSKQLYLLLSHFFRKLLLFLNLKFISLFIKFIPKYFSEILNLLIRRTPNFYAHPFTKELINETSNIPSVTDTYYSINNIC